MKYDFRVRKKDGKLYIKEKKISKKIIIISGILILLGAITYGILIFKYGERNLEYKYGAEYGFGSNKLAAVVGVKDKDNLTDITIPNKVFKGFRFYEVRLIANNAFENCYNLKNITISDGLGMIDDYAFANCTSLENVNIEANLSTIGHYAFSNCSSLKNITIPDCAIGEGYPLFEKCNNLENIHIRKTQDVVNLYDKNGVLYSCGDLVCYPAGKVDEYYIVESGTKIIFEPAFNNCKNLKSIRIPSSVERIDEGTFKGCNNLTDIYFDGYLTKNEKWNNEWLGCSATIHWDNQD